jgi:hypothetical protein
MVRLTHDRFGMVCSTTTCCKMKCLWLRVVEAEERGERLDPADAQGQVRRESLRVGGKKMPVPDSNDHGRGVVHQQTRKHNGIAPSNPLTLSPSPTRIDNTSIPLAVDMATCLLQHQQQQQAPPRQYAPQYVPQRLLHRQKPPHVDLQLQEQLQTELAHAAFHPGLRWRLSWWQDRR